ncbi:MBL fold metallo-hydrolase [Nocardioides yefusunii]|uniref:MBL fold metallo-hydrolase n=1 Tax=Nocardioides yefusunii TaxID=2500546 RepID=A0ABW1QWN5_9ACTN|nr:MBL fold metallo-hydrolase [Nocardioides yefusunii]
MRLRFGRPDLLRWIHLTDVPVADPVAAAAGSVLQVAWLGVSTVLVTDGTSAVMTDGFFSRPSLLRTGLAPLVPDRARIEHALDRMGILALDAVLPVHSHYDHVLDSATVAARTGADVYGGTSTLNVVVGHGLPPERVTVVESGETHEVGGFEITLVESSHCPPDRFPGEIEEPVMIDDRAREYRCGEAWSTLIHHPATGRRLLVQGSAGCVPGALEGQQAEVVMLGVGQLGVQEDAYVEEYWNETVGRVGAKVAVVVHHDNFFRPLDAPLRALPYAVDDLDVTLQRLEALAERDGVRLHLPTLWDRTDPWRSLPV